MMLKRVFADARFATPELARELYRSRALPSARNAVRLDVFDSCSHWPHMERSEEFNQLALDLVSGA